MLDLCTKIENQYMTFFARASMNMKFSSIFDSVNLRQLFTLLFHNLEFKAVFIG